MMTIVLKLFITGQTPRSQQAITNLHRICQRELAGWCELHIIDVLEQPQLAERENILATPTLIRELPPPRRRFVGDLSDVAGVLLGLNLHPATQGDSDD